MLSFYHNSRKSQQRPGVSQIHTYYRAIWNLVANFETDEKWQKQRAVLEEIIFSRVLQSNKTKQILLSDEPLSRQEMMEMTEAGNKKSKSRDKKGERLMSERSGEYVVIDKDSNKMETVSRDRRENVKSEKTRVKQESAEGNAESSISLSVKQNRPSDGELDGVTSRVVNVTDGNNQTKDHKRLKRRKSVKSGADRAVKYPTNQSTTAQSETGGDVTAAAANHVVTREREIKQHQLKASRIKPILEDIKSRHKDHRTDSEEGLSSSPAHPVTKDSGKGDDPAGDWLMTSFDDVLDVSYGSGNAAENTSSTNETTAMQKQPLHSQTRSESLWDEVDIGELEKAVPDTRETDNTGDKHHGRSHSGYSKGAFSKQARIHDMDETDAGNIVGSDSIKPSEETKTESNKPTEELIARSASMWEDIDVGELNQLAEKLEMRRTSSASWDDVDIDEARRLMMETIYEKEDDGKAKEADSSGLSMVFGPVGRTLGLKVNPRPPSPVQEEEELFAIKHVVTPLSQSVLTQERQLDEIATKFLIPLQKSQAKAKGVTLAKMTRCMRLDRLVEVLEGAVWLEKKLISWAQGTGEEFNDAKVQTMKSAVNGAINASKDLENILARVRSPTQVGVHKPLHGTSLETFIARVHNIIEDLLLYLRPAMLISAGHKGDYTRRYQTERQSNMEKLEVLLATLPQKYILVLSG